MHSKLISLAAFGIAAFVLSSADLASAQTYSDWSTGVRHSGSTKSSRASIDINEFGPDGGDAYWCTDAAAGGYNCVAQAGGYIAPPAGKTHRARVRCYVSSTSSSYITRTAASYVTTPSYTGYCPSANPHASRPQTRMRSTTPVSFVYYGTKN